MSRVAPLGKRRNQDCEQGSDCGGTMAQTITEKVVQAHAEGLEPGYEVRAGDMVTVRPFHVMTHDNTGAVIPKFRTIGAERVARSVTAGLHPRPQRPGHEPREPGQVPADRGVRRASRASSSIPAGAGIGHQLMVEQGFVHPGTLVVASRLPLQHVRRPGARSAPRSCAPTPPPSGPPATTWWQVPAHDPGRARGRAAAGGHRQGRDHHPVRPLQPGEVLNAAVEFTAPAWPRCRCPSA